MIDWPDAKIRSTALRYINQHAMDLPIWRYTLVGNAQTEVLSRIELKPGELPLVSFFLEEASWYLLSTRRVLGAYADQNVDLAALGVLLLVGEGHPNLLVRGEGPSSRSRGAYV